MALFKQTGLICEDSIVHPDMNDVLNLKLGTSQVDYPANSWADNVSVLGEPLPSKTASGSIAHFTDGADTVPLDTGIFYFNPVQASGTPTPSSPIAIYGHTGLTINRSGADMSAPTTYPVSWTEEGTIYGGYYNSVTGELWKTRKKYIFDENLPLGDFGLEALTGYARVSYIPFQNEGKGNTAFLSNTLKYIIPSATKEVYSIWNSTTAPRMFIALPDTITTKQEVIDFFTNYPTEVIAELATPVLVAVIDPTKIKTFEGVNNIWNDGGGISEVGYRSKASGGGVIPTFAETLLADDSSLTGTLDFDGADYNDYALIRCELYNDYTLKNTSVLLTPQTIADMFANLSNGICFNEYANNQYAYYKANSSGNWIRGGNRNLWVKKVYGLTGSNCNISVTNIFRLQSSSSSYQAITTIDDLFDYDYIIASCLTGSDGVPCAYVINTGTALGDMADYFYPNVANAYNAYNPITVSQHEISSYYWFCVDGIKFT